MTTNKITYMNYMSKSNQTPQAIFLIGVISSLFAGCANAANDYRCTIEKRINSSPESPVAQKVQEKAYIGKQFKVERATGIMAGALQNAFTNDPEIVDDGSTGKGYKVVSTIKAEEEHVYGSGVYALVIDGSETSLQKPFVFMENNIVYFGQCESIKLGH